MAGGKCRLSRIYGPAIIPLQLGAKNGLFQAFLTLAKTTSEVDPSASPYQRRGEATNPVSFEYELFRTPVQIDCPGISGALAPRVATWGQDAKIGKMSNPGWPARVSFRSNLVKPRLDPRALISPLVPCIEVCLAVPLAAYCSPRRWSCDGAEKCKNGKIWQCAIHPKLHN